MKGRRRNLLCTLCLLMVAALIFLWTRSHGSIDQVISGSGTRRWLIILNRGILQVGRSQANGTPLGSVWHVFSASEYPDNPSWFFYYVSRAGTGWAFGIPMWFPVAAITLWFLFEFHRGRLIPPGSCQRCGYDLRATPERCPECGSVAG